MDQSTLTVEELRAILIAGAKADAKSATVLTQRINEALGRPSLPEPPEITNLKEVIQDRLYTLLAERLVINNREVPLLSSEDITNSITNFLSEEAANQNSPLSGMPEKDRAIFSKFIGSIFENALIQAYKSFNGENPYDRQWRRVRTILELAEENGLSPLEFLETDEASDQIIGRYFKDADEYRSCLKEMLGFLSVDGMKKIVMEPMLALFETLEPDATEERRQQTLADMEQDLMPMIQQTLTIAQAALESYTNEVVNRIWPNNS